MASITIRNLDEDTKQALRERAARNGRSMEEEARILLGAGATDSDFPSTDASLSEISRKQNSIDPYYPAAGKNILLIISGGIAAYKSLDLVRRLKERGVGVRVVMTKAAEEFITPLSVGALSHDKVFTQLFSREDEQDVGHIRLAREADLIVVAPATANLIAKMGNGLADDLASAILLAADTPILIAPSMNPAMWNNTATVRNVGQLMDDGIHFIGPDNGEMAEQGEAGRGRMADVMNIVSDIGALLDNSAKPLAGLKAIITAGPTHEPIDPVRYIANRSSGKQGYAIAGALARAGAQVKLVSGSTRLQPPSGVQLISVQTAVEMKKEVEANLPADIAIMVAAVADWRTATSADEKIKKKRSAKTPPPLKLIENPDILHGVGHHKNRPSLVIGFAAETEKVVKHARAKLERKGADWILANDVSPETGVMGGDENTIKLLSATDVDEWETMSKSAVAEKLVEKIVSHFEAEVIDV